METNKAHNDVFLVRLGHGNERLGGKRKGDYGSVKAILLGYRKFTI